MHQFARSEIQSEEGCSIFTECLELFFGLEIGQNHFSPLNSIRKRRRIKAILSILRLCIATLLKIDSFADFCSYKVEDRWWKLIALRVSLTSDVVTCIPAFAAGILFARPALDLPLVVGHTRAANYYKQWIKPKRKGCRESRNQCQVSKK